MPSVPLELPILQNWNCHNCSGCCRQHLIEVTEEERQRIEQQGWSAEDGIAEGQPVMVAFAGPPWRRRYRLAHQPDGACVFLNDQGLCRIHAKFGESAKPLACRIYPYAFHPSGKRVAISLRFSCPSVVNNWGRPVAEQKGELKRLAGLAVPNRLREVPAPKISPSEQLDWPDFLRIVGGLDDLLATPNVPILDKLTQSLSWIDLIEQATFEKIQGRRLDEFLQIVSEAVAHSGSDSESAEPPSRLGRIQFRLLVAQYARKDTLARIGRGWRDRWTLLRAATRFARGTGLIPPLQDCFQAVPFERLEQPFGALPDEAEEIFTRYFRVKVRGIHFCGPAYYGVPLVEGFRSLVLVFPAVLWLARWLAAGEERTFVSKEDLVRALTIADHHHGYSPAFGQRVFRKRVQILAKLNDIGRLCSWYHR